VGQGDAKAIALLDQGQELALQPTGRARGIVRTPSGSRGSERITRGLAKIISIILVYAIALNSAFYAFGEDNSWALSE